MTTETSPSSPDGSNGLSVADPETRDAPETPDAPVPDTAILRDVLAICGASATRLLAEGARSAGAALTRAGEVLGRLAPEGGGATVAMRRSE